MDSRSRLTRAPALTAVRTPAAEPGADARPHELHALTLPWPHRLATPAALLALCLLSLAFFWKVVALHEVLLPADILYAHDPLWASLAPHTFTAPANPLDSDALTEFYPWAALAAQALHRGIVPLWNPYAFAGTPFLAAMQTAVFYPINVLLEWLAPPPDVLGLRALVHLIVTLTGTFLLARRLHMSHLAALLAALAFGLSLPYVAWIEHPMAGAIAWLPWLLLCIDGIVATRAALRWVVAASGLLAVEVLAGHGESTAHGLLLCAAFAIFRAIGARRAGGSGRIALALIGALGLGLGIAAAFLAPTLAQLPFSEAAADRAASAPAGLLGDPAAWKTLVVAAIPDFFGNPTWHVALLPPALGYNEVALYVGAIPLLLAVVAVLRRRSAHTAFFAVAALVALGMALRLPLLGLLDNLPLLRVAANGRLRAEYALAVALLAGYGLDGLARDGAPATAWRLARAWVPAVGVLAALAVAVLLYAHPGNEAVPPATAALAALPLLWLALFAALLWLHRRGWLARPALRGGAVALTALDLFALGAGYHAVAPRSEVATVPPAVRAVQRDHTLYRVAGLGGALLPSLSSLYGLQDIRGYDPAYSADYERYFGQRFSMRGMRLALAPFGPSPAAARALNLLNVKYIFASCAIVVNTRFYRPVYRGAGCVYRNTSVLPRALLVHDLRWAVPARAAELLDRNAVDPRRTVLLDPATAGTAPWRAGPPAPGREWVRVTGADLNAVTVDLYSRGPGMLVLADAYAPGWQAQVDGRPAPIARADAVLRAVAVGPGPHRVRFIYRPQAFSAGVAVSAAAGAAWLVLLLAALWPGTLTRRQGQIVEEHSA